MFLIALLNSLIFFILSILHFYWVFGGKWGMGSVIPTKDNSTDKLFQPSALSITVVAIGLLIFAFVAIGTTGTFSDEMDSNHFRWGNLFIAFIFLIRAVGDFNYVGFFKKIKNTVFALNDTRYYSPLCLFIAITSLFMAFTN